MVPLYDFKLSDAEIKKLNAWRKSHPCSAGPAAIGGRLTFSFTPTGLGCLSRVTCACGKSKDLNSSEDW